MPCKLMQPVFIAASEITFSETDEGFFVEGFLISDKINQNGWMVTQEANQLDGHEWVGRPDILFIKNGRLDHTTGDSFEASMEAQEPFRKGTMQKILGIETGRRLTSISKIEDPDIIQRIKNKEIKWTSPAVFPRSLADVEIIPTGPNSHIHILHRYRPLHRAFVDEPAYGRGETQLGLTCEGNSKECLVKLEQLKAGISYEAGECTERYATIKDGKQRVEWNSEQHQLLHVRNLPHSHVCIKNGEKVITRWSKERHDAGIGDDEIGPLRTVPIVVKKCEQTGNLILEMEASELSEEVSKCLSEKGGNPTDQDIAICFSEAREKLKKKANSSLIPEKSAKNQMPGGNEEVTRKELDDVKAQLKDMSDDVKKALKAQTETEEEKKAQEEEEKEEARKAQEEKDKKNGKRGKHGQEPTPDPEKTAQELEEEKKAQEEEEKKDARIAVLENKQKLPIIKKFIAARMHTPGFDEAQGKKLETELMKASLDDVEAKWNEIAPFVGAMNLKPETTEEESQIGYFGSADYTGVSEIEKKTTEELLEEAGIDN